MKNIQYSLISVLVVTWMYSVFFHSSTNSNEKRLLNNTLPILERSNDILLEGQENLKWELYEQIFKRPDDQPIYDAADSTLKATIFTKQQLEVFFKQKKNQRQSIDLTYSEWDTIISQLLYQIQKMSPVITEKEINELINQIDLDSYIYSFPLTNYQRAMILNQLLTSSNSVIGFLSSKVGYGIYCNWGPQPVLITEGAIPLGEQLHGKLLLTDYIEQAKYSIIIEDQLRIVKDGVAKFDTTFYKIGKQTLDARAIWTKEQLINRKRMTTQHEMKDTLDFYVF